MLLIKVKVSKWLPIYYSIMKKDKTLLPRQLGDAHIRLLRIYKTVIESGVKPNDLVIDKGSRSVRGGDKVQEVTL